MSAVFAEDSLLGEILDHRYRIDQVLGVGGMGAVYRGTHLVLDQPVAIKVMRSSQPDAATRFLTEAQRTFQLDSRHCVRVTDAGAAANGLLYLVMELLEGRTLGEELAHDIRISPARVIHIGSQIADAIHCAHQQGFIHRDLKPDNIMLLHRDGDSDFTKVLDFGVAKLIATAQLNGNHSVISLTQNGMVFGTPPYMSPEQAQGKPLEASSDIYALAIVLYQALSGTVPFSSPSDVEVLLAHIQSPPPPLTRYGELPPALEELIMSMLAKNPANRPSSAAQVANALRAIRATEGGNLLTSIAASETLSLSSVSNRAASATEHKPSHPRPLESTSRGELNEHQSQSRSRKRLILAATLVTLVLALATTVWTLRNQPSQNTVASYPNNEHETDQETPTETSNLGESGTIKQPVVTLIDANTIDASAADVINNNNNTTNDSGQRKERRARRLYQRAMSNWRRGADELDYVPLLDEARRLDRHNRKIRRAFIRALLGSQDPTAHSRGCQWIRNDAKRWAANHCQP